LLAAEQEATDFKTSYAGTAVVLPLFRDVIACLEGDPAADLLHIALHGQVDPQGNDEGLVLLSLSADGKYSAQYLQSQHIESVDLPNSPFVFLNACQVGAGKQVLGDYAGLAAAFLRAGAAAVVAPLWNVDDGVASEIALEFYQRALADSPVPISEILRDIRSR
jgi:CHAT domain-containing protein